MEKELDSRDKILAEAYCQLSTKGIESTKVDDIAKSLKMSKKTIYALFRSKEEIVIQTFLWKLKLISTKAQEVVDGDLPVVEKLIKYLEVIYTNLDGVSFLMIGNLLSNRTVVEEMMNDYLKEAVFGRFSKLFDQASKEGIINEKTDPNSTLMMYWETLSTFLFARPVKFPSTFNIKIPINQLLGNQMVNLYRGILNDQGIKEFDSVLKSHIALSKVFG